MKALVMLRALSIVAAVLCAAASFATGSAAAERLRRTARLATIAACGAQTVLVGREATLGRVPWTRALLPVAGIALAWRSFEFGNAPVAWTFVALDAAVAIYAAIVLVRLRNRTPGEEPEDVLQAAFERLADGPLARFVAVELVTLAAALRFCTGGFRAPLPEGFSYVRTWTEGPVLLAAPIVFVLPEMIAFDFALSGHPWYWRAVSDALHAYGMLWLVGIFATARLRPHRCDGGRVRFRFATLRRFEVECAAIAHVDVWPQLMSTRELRTPRTLVMARAGTPAIDVALRAPVCVRSPFGRRRDVDRVIVSVDNPHGLAGALLGSA